MAFVVWFVPLPPSSLFPFSLFLLFLFPLSPSSSIFFLPISLSSSSSLIPYFLRVPSLCFLLTLLQLLHPLSPFAYFVPHFAGPWVIPAMSSSAFSPSLSPISSPMKSPCIYVYYVWA